MHPAEGVNYEEIDAKDPETLTEVEKIALLGRPRLGDVTKISIRIKESKEFKSSVDRMMQRSNASMMMGATTWKDQFLEAFTVQAGKSLLPFSFHFARINTGWGDSFFLYTHHTVDTHSIANVALIRKALHCGGK